MLGIGRRFEMDLDYFRLALNEMYLISGNGDMLKPEKWVEPDVKLCKCCHCGAIFEERDWSDPPSCPGCHISRVD